MYNTLSRLLCIALVLTCFSVPSFAVEPDEVLDDPKLEARARELSLQMRCLVCQNQSIDDSDAPLAKDLRVLIRKRLVEGDTNEQVVEYLVSRYGEFVLLNPRFKANTVLLWTGPFIILLIGMFVVWRRRKRTPATIVPEEKLSAKEKQALDEILNDN